MKKKFRMDGISAGMLIILALLLSSCTQNWPQFRGPDANLVAKAKNLPNTWSETENIRWSADIEGESTSSGVLWSDLDAPTSYSSPLLYEGLLYLLDVRGRELTCLDAATGEEVYQEKIDDVAACWASPWAHEDKIFFTDEKGVTTVLKAGREFQLLHRNILDDKVWASVAVSSDAYLIKGSAKIYCIAN